MIECVMVDTLPETANQILNILWDRNHAMNETEIREALEQEFSVKCEKAGCEGFHKVSDRAGLCGEEA